MPSPCARRLGAVATAVQGSPPLSSVPEHQLPALPPRGCRNCRPAVHEDAPWIFPSGTLAGAERRVGAATSAGLFTVVPMEGHYTAGRMDLGAHVPTLANIL